MTKIAVRTYINNELYTAPNHYFVQDKNVVNKNNLQLRLNHVNSYYAPKSNIAYTLEQKLSNTMKTLNTIQAWAAGIGNGISNAQKNPG